jgi:hypothetical protein
VPIRVRLDVVAGRRRFAAATHASAR